MATLYVVSVGSGLASWGGDESEAFSAGEVAIALAGAGWVIVAAGGVARTPHDPTPEIQAECSRA